MAAGIVLRFNGVDGATGANYTLDRPLAALETRLRALVRDEGLEAPPPLSGLLGIRLERGSSLAAGGWGVVYPAERAELAEAIAPLVSHREGQLKRRPPILDRHLNEDYETWARRHGDRLGEPEDIPHALLVLGVPTAIPFEFVRSASIDHAVGCLGFDEIDAYVRYAKSVMRYETTESSPPTDRRVAFWAPAHDPATELSHRYLIPPMMGKACSAGYRVEGSLGNAATKEQLTARFVRPPALIVSASHGLAFPFAHADQRRAQGNLVGADWDRQARTQHVGAADLAESSLAGTVFFAFGCHTAGTPAFDSNAQLLETPSAIAPAPFLSRLSCAALERGALGFIGHVDRAYACAFLADEHARSGSTHSFRRAVADLLEGMPLGHALHSFAHRYAALSEVVGTGMFNVARGLPHPASLAMALLEWTDAGAYLLVGDPGCSIRVEGGL